jgi:hypothetical protein
MTAIYITYIISDHIIAQYNISIPGVNVSKKHSIELPIDLAGDPTVSTASTALFGIASSKVPKADNIYK